MASGPSFTSFSFKDLAVDTELASQEPVLKNAGKESPKENTKRLARCGKCNNCKSQDCGSCYNCADKPKFGGPGIKKQACINRKCLLMVPRDEEGEKIARKRSKQRGPKPIIIPAGFGARALTNGNSSPPSSPDDDWREEHFGRESPSDLSNDGGADSTRMDPVDPASEVSELERAAEELFGSNMKIALPATRPEIRPELRADARPEIRPEARTEPRADAWRAFNVDSTNAMMPPLPWDNVLLLQEEFILMNDLHRRESKEFVLMSDLHRREAQASYPVAAF